MAKLRIHHTQKAQAEKIGAILSVDGDMVKAIWPERGAVILGATASEALEKLREVQDAVRDEDQQEIPEVNVKEMMDDETEEDDEETEDEADEEGSDVEEEEEERVSSSVVKEKYRLKYRELGHPANCGDWLAQVLENHTLTKKGSDIWRFRDICELNDVDMSKYKTYGNGWQGRYRMTGRNKLAKVLFEREVLLVPGFNGEQEEIPVPEHWKAEQRFQKEAK